MKAAKDQLDRNMEFNGQGTPVSYKQLTGYSGNASRETAKENYGMGPRKGNTGDRSVPNVTARSGKINGGAQAKCPTNPDKINAGSGPRKGNQ